MVYEGAYGHKHSFGEGTGCARKVGRDKLGTGSRTGRPKLGEPGSPIECLLSAPCQSRSGSASTRPGLHVGGLPEAQNTSGAALLGAAWWVDGNGRQTLCQRL